MVGDFKISAEQEEHLVMAYSEQQLFIKLRQRQLAAIEGFAILMIQKFIRMIIQRLRWIKERTKRLDAVCRIQRSYRGYRRWRIIPKMLRQRKERNCIIVQKHLQGYLARKRFVRDIHELKIQTNMAFFTDLREKLYKNSCDIISLHWLRYMVRKITRMQADYADLEKLKAKEKKCLRNK